MRQPRVWAIGLPAVLAAALYWPSLALPVLYDDLLHIRLTGNLNWVTVWLPNPAFGFYRPLTFVPLLIIQALFGRYPALVLHALNVGQHALDAAWLAALAWRVWRKPGLALAAGLLLAAYPFSYQAVAVYGHNVHPALVGLLLPGLHAALCAWRSPRPAGWWAAVGLIFIIGLLTHESAVLFGPLVLLLALVEGAPGWRALFGWRYAPGWLLCVLGAAYVLVYRTGLLTPGPAAVSPGAGDGLLVGLYLLQAAVYPLAWFAHWFPVVPADRWVGASAAVTALGMLWAARRPAWRRGLLLAWGWWALSAALLAATLSADYLLHGPRLLYLGSVGLALAWALAGQAILETWPAPVRRAAGVGLLGVLLLLNGRFVAARLADYARLTRPLSQVAAALAGRPAEAGLVLVNWPAWVSPARNTYPVGGELAAMLGYHLFAEELVNDNLGGDHPVRALELSELRSTPASYYYGLHTQSAAPEWGAREWQVFVTRYLEVGPSAAQRGWFSPPGAARAVLFSLGPYQLTGARAQVCGTQVVVETDWQMPGLPADAPPTLSLYAHVLDAGGALLGQSDGPPLDLPPSAFPARAGLQFTDRRSLQAPGGAAQVSLGAYDYLSGAPIPALDAAGQPRPEGAFGFAVRACP